MPRGSKTANDEKIVTRPVPMEEDGSDEPIPGPRIPEGRSARAQVTFQKKWTEDIQPEAVSGGTIPPPPGRFRDDGDYEHYQRQMEMMGEGEDKISYWISVVENGQETALGELSPSEIEADNIQLTLRNRYGGSGEGKFVVRWQDPDTEEVRTKEFSIQNVTPKWKQEKLRDPLDIITGGIKSGNDPTIELFKIIMIRDQQRTESLAQEATDQRKLNNEMMANMVKIFATTPREGSGPQRDPIDLSLKMFDIFATKLASVSAAPVAAQGANWEKIANIGLRVLERVPDLFERFAGAPEGMPWWAGMIRDGIKDGLPALRDIIVSSKPQGGVGMPPATMPRAGRIPQPPEGMMSEQPPQHDATTVHNEEMATASARQQFENHLLPQLRKAAEGDEEPYDWAEMIRAQSGGKIDINKMLHILGISNFGEFYDRYRIPPNLKDWFSDLFSYLMDPTLKPREEEEGVRQ